MFYLNTIEEFLVEQFDQGEVCLTYSRLLTGIPILAVFKNLRWNSNKTSLVTLGNICFNQESPFKERRATLHTKSIYLTLGSCFFLIFSPGEQYLGHVYCPTAPT